MHYITSITNQAWPEITFDDLFVGTLVQCTTYTLCLAGLLYTLWL